MQLSKISDEDIYKEYCNRFTLHAGEQLNSPDKVSQHLRLFFKDDLHKEKFVVLFLNGRNQLITTEVLFEGI
jgi:DNA repair protein RadC